MPGQTQLREADHTLARAADPGAAGAREQSSPEARKAATAQQRHGNQAVNEATTGKKPAPRSGGDPLEPAVVARASSALGGDQPGGDGQPGETVGGLLRQVRVHTDPQAGALAESHNARALTMGRDIYFREGQFSPDTAGGWELLLHELTHVIQSRGAAPRSPDTHADAGHPAEQEAERVAAGAAAGKTVGDIGAQAGQGAHRDAMSDLDTAASGNWIGNVDEGDCLARVRGMGPDERQRLTGRHDLMRKLCAAFNAREMFELVELLPLDLRWKVYWIMVAGEIGDISAGQWQAMVSSTTDSGFASLRTYPEGWAAFLEHAPKSCLPPIERLNALASGNWIGNVDEGACLATISELSPAQRAEVRGRTDIMNKLCAALNAEEMFQCIRVLEFELQWQVYWLAVAGETDNLKEEKWSTMLLEAPAGQFQALVEYPFGWAAV
jgi:hypothetical protein